MDPFRPTTSPPLLSPNHQQESLENVFFQLEPYYKIKALFLRKAGKLDIW